jgi:hypothetical protein
MADDWSNARKPPINNKAVNKNTTKQTNSINPNNKGSYKPTGNIVPKKENKKAVFSSLINDGVCVNCLFGNCKNHQTIDERIPENLVKYVKAPNFIRNFGDELLNVDFGINAKPIKYSTCKFMLSSCDNCNNGRCTTMNYQSNDITLCYSKPNNNGGFFAGVHIDIHYEEKFKGFDLTVLPFNTSNIKIQLDEDDVKSVSSNNSRENIKSLHVNNNNNNNIENIIEKEVSYAKIANDNNDVSKNQELIDMTQKYSDMVSRYNKLNEDLMTSKDLIRKNQELKQELSESNELNNNLKSEKNKLINELVNLKKEIDLLKNNNRLLTNNLENNKIQVELDNIVSRQIINTHIDRYSIFNQNI